MSTMNVNGTTNTQRQDNNNISLPNQQVQQRKKCHGNRRDQRFRRKCRAQKMQPAKIEKLIKKRHRIQKKNQNNNSTGRTANDNNTNSTTRQNNQHQQTNTTVAPTMTTNFNKRKRDISVPQFSKITDSSSTLQQSSLQKKIKHTTNTTITSNPIINTNYQ